MERYGDVRSIPSNPGNTFRIENVRFTGCTMQWVERASIAEGRVIQERVYTLHLRDVGRKPGNLQVQTDGLTVSLNGPSTPGALRYVENIKHSDGEGGKRPGSDNVFTVTLQNKDDIARRIGTALIHAARLCSASAE